MQFIDLIDKITLAALLLMSFILLLVNVYPPSYDLFSTIFMLFPFLMIFLVISILLSRYPDPIKALGVLMVIGLNFCSFGSRACIAPNVILVIAAMLIMILLIFWIYDRSNKKKKKK